MRTSTIRLVLLAAMSSLWPTDVDAADTLPPGAMRRLGPIRQFASPRTGLVAFSADGTRLVAGAGEHTIHVWDWPAVKPPRTLLRPEEDVATCAALSPDGKTLAVGTAAATVLMRDLRSGAVRRTQCAARGAVQDIAFSADGKRFVTFGTDAVLQCWEKGAVPAWSATFSERKVQCLICAGDRLFAGCDDGTIRSWSIDAGKPLAVWTTGRSVRALAVTPDGRTAFAEGQDHVVLAWDVAAGRPVGAFEGHTEAVLALTCTRDGRRLASAGIDGGVRVWDAETGEQLARLYGEYRTALAMAFAPDGRTLVVATPDSFIDRWDLDTPERASLLGGHREEVDAVAFADGGREVYSWSASESRRWREATGELLGDARGDRPARPRLVTSPGGRYRVTIDPDLSVFPALEYRAPDLPPTDMGKEVTLGGALRSVRGAAFSRDDKILAAAGSDGNVTLWETLTGDVLAEFKAHDGRASCIAFAPDGRTFATGGADASILVWSLTACGPPLPERWHDPAEDDLETIWKALWGDNGPDAFAAVRALIASPKKAVPFLRGKLPPALDLRRMKQCIAQLDSDEFETREKASQELERMGRDAEQALRDALAARPSAEVKRRVGDLLNNLKGDDMPRVRAWSRAVFVLEQIGTPDARAVLKLLADGDRVAKAAEDARAALQRK